MRASILITLALLSPVGLSQSTWYVDQSGAGDFTAIQEAINSSSVLDGDTVTVRDGAYIENIDFNGKTIWLMSENGPSTTIIDGNQTGSGVTFQNGEGSGAVLDGFTVTNGSGTLEGTYTTGGGIYCSSSSPTIENNTISGNNAQRGAGIYCSQGSPTIENNIVSDNIGEWGHGGGIYLIDSSSPTIDNNTITRNDSQFGGGIYFASSSPTIKNNTVSENTVFSGGGGIYCYEDSPTDSSSPTIENNTVSENTGGSQGGGIYCYQSSPAITNNIISGNSGVRSGGGIYCSQCSPAIDNNIVSDNVAEFGGGFSCDWSYSTISNNLIVRNTAIAGISSRSGSGGGLSLLNGAVHITNNTLSGNSAVFGGGISCWTPWPVITNTILWDNSAPNGPEIWRFTWEVPTVTYCDVKGGWLGTGNIDLDPLFVDSTNGDFHLKQLGTHMVQSPCVDSGVGAAYSGSTRLDGVQDADPFDMGYHYPASTGCNSANYCRTTPNSVGDGAVISHTGSGSVAANDLSLTSAGCPTNQFGIFYFGPVAADAPLGNGVRCVGGGGVGLSRFPPINTGSGTAQMPLDNTASPASGQIAPGTTRYFQFWYRDPNAGGANSNLSDALLITFCP